MKREEIRKLISEAESKHFRIPDQAYRRSEQHNLISIQLANDILELIDSDEDLFESFYKTKSEIFDQLKQ